jgi:hypothetical protein
MIGKQGCLTIVAPERANEICRFLPKGVARPVNTVVRRPGDYEATRNPIRQAGK